MLLNAYQTEFKRIQGVLQNSLRQLKVELIGLIPEDLAIRHKFDYITRNNKTYQVNQLKNQVNSETAPFVFDLNLIQVVTN